MTTQLTGFDAVQLAGLYTKDGEERLTTQKTVVIPTGVGLLGLQLNADTPKGDAPVLRVTTAAIDEQAAIRP